MIFMCYVAIECRSKPRVAVHPEIVEESMTNSTEPMEPVDSPSPPSYADLEKSP